MLLPKDICKIGNVGASSDLCSPNGAFVKEKFGERKWLARIKERVVTLKFKALHHQWKEDVRLLSVRKCRPKSHKKLEVGMRTTNCGYQKNRSSVRTRISCPGNNLSMVPTPEIINFASKLLSEPQVRVHRSTLKMPALILDEKEKTVSRFPSRNGLIEDPLAYEKERAMINLWTSEEKDIFMEKFAAFGKDFRKIASFLDHKTTADCVEFYYKNHKSDCFDKIKQDVRKLEKSFLTNPDLVGSGKKWNRDVNTASLEILSAASAMAGHADNLNGNRKMRPGSSLLGGYGNIKTSKGENSILGRSNSFDALGDEREAVAADVLAGICGSLSSEAMSSCITSSVDPVEGNRDRKCLKVNPVRKQLTVDVTQNVDDETCSDESCEEMDPADWTDEEKSAFLQAVSSFGKDFAKISRCVGSRSQDQCKVFFSKARKCLGLDLMRPQSVNAGYPVNDDANGGGSDTDDACVVETGSAIGTDRSGTKTDEDQPMSVMNAYSDEFNPVEARNLSADLNKSNNISRPELDHQDAEDVDNMVSDACEMKGKSELGSGGGEDVLYSSDKSGSATGQTNINMLASIEVGKDEANNLACGVTKSVLCQSNSSVEVKLVSEDSSGGFGKELERQKPSLSQCLDERDNKHEAAADGVELKSSVQDSSRVVNASISSVGNSCTGLDLEAENELQASGPSISALPLENSQSTGNSLQDTIAVRGEKTASQDQLPSTRDFQGSRDMHFHNSTSNGGQQSHIPRHLLDHVEATSVLQGFPLPIKKEVNGDLSCSSSATELPFLSQKTEQATDHYETQLRHSLDSEVTSRNGDVKLFGKILTNPSSTQKSNQSSKGREENGANHSKFSSKSPSLKFNGQQNADKNSTMLKFGSNDYNMGLENVPMRTYGYWDGSKIQTGVPSLPDSAILLAKYPAAFSNYPTSSAKLEQQSLQAFTKSAEQHLNGASAFATREINSSNGVVDYQMFRSRDVPKVQPFMVDMKHHQDVFSDVQRRNSFEAISNLQQQGRGMVGLNGVGRPGILVGGSHSGVSDFVAAIKMHYSNSEQYGQNGSMMREDESWGGKKGDLSR